jgi:YVTN family beta-propeller protein
MKTKLKFFSLVALTSALLFLSACDKDKDPVKGDYQTGVLIVNEGNFSSSDGDITYYNASSGLQDQAIYNKVNGAFAGKVLQSVTLDGDIGLLVLNGDNKIEIVNSNTFKTVNTFTDQKLVAPRYAEPINGKVYISVWGPYDANFSLVDSYVLVMDFKTMQVVTTIDTDEGTENLFYNGKYLFASNYNYGASNTVAVIDPSTNTVVKNIELAAGPSGIVADANNKIWVITSSGVDGKLFRINPTTFAIEQTISLTENPGGDLAVSSDKKSLYYSVGNDIYKISIDATSAPTTAWVHSTDIVSLYALGADPKTGEVYAGDALNFATAGFVYVYNPDGSFKVKLNAGIDPTQFVFR